MLGVIEDFTPGEVAVFLEAPIAEGEDVKIHVEDFAFNGEVLLCRQCGSQYEVHVSINDFNELGLRRAPRFSVNLDAHIFAPSLGRPLVVKIVDISGYGIGIELPEPLPKESTVAVKTEANTVLGVVR